MAIIKKKFWPQYFDLVASGKKKFDLRLADFDVQEGDTLILEEWDPVTTQYTGRTIEKTVDFVLKFDLNSFGQAREIQEKGLYVIQIK
ncbi:MAG: RNA-binding protein [Candidatus Nealsonbacteria bacterium CG_4_10_14_0_2_um_filter_38_17]|uniref:RNA-binding protein n=2 Tax=Candidatus Nealsoniibacteriota TaxID=1817911 RepID=A0A2M7UYI7_9BACT|nr:MAG: RNA-binding protein [Candidatus Nealsonbacteria bacterium CG23_combo_of_CG06-09_8_20_14_all_38_19]PIZ89051.1 MAG: RNA-binding protein [Candidatus Nealsonbacteria bacterium CG_4_10_14_0_2_um_filter_38_17]